MSSVIMDHLLEWRMYYETAQGGIQLVNGHLQVKHELRVRKPGPTLRMYSDRPKPKILNGIIPK